MNKLKDEKKLLVISALTEGNSIRSIERMTGGYALARAREEV